MTSAQKSGQGVCMHIRVNAEPYLRITAGARSNCHGHTMNEQKAD